MALGNNKPQEQKQDKLIKDTRIARNTRIAPKKSFKTKEKMTFYIEKELLESLYNLAYWDRLSLTEAFNSVVKDGLKGKNIKKRINTD